MERIKTIATRDLTKSVVTGGCGECPVSYTNLDVYKRQVCC